MKIGLVDELESHWDFDTGFFGKLRNGKFDANEFQRLISTLEKIDYSQKSSLDKREVALLWYIPIFMTWQRERVLTEDLVGSDYDKAANQVEASIGRILGVP